MPSLAQIGPEPIGARGWGMGNAMVALPQDQSVFYNPAGVGFLDNNFASASFHAPLDLPRLSTAGLNTNIALKPLNLGLGIERFGDHLYNESKIGITLAKKIDRIALGIKGSYFNASAQDVNSNSTVLMEFGVMAMLQSSLRIGFHAYNITAAKLFLDQRIPTVLRGGFAFEPSEKITITGEVESIPSEFTFVKAGLEYQIANFLALRTGINSRVKSNHFGLGYMGKKWNLDYALHTHPSLGLSNHLTLKLDFDGQK
ncbi:hypothetical protein SAMN06298216_1324 [Spirosomataceae bacterium TFI 002]|nr:hypothetical protein SAMN06298216_1324 [Spirosomataceae bacterium TFI 002]